MSSFARNVSGTLVALLLLTAMAVGCGSSEKIDPTPEKLDGTESLEFESEDLERAENASDAVRDYCAGAVSEAQEVGCLSHVDESDIP